jgi:hypothetical protein
MRQLKFAFISFFFLSALVMGFSALLPSKTNVSRAIVINKNSAMVMQELQNIPNWKNWNYNERVAKNNFVTTVLFRTDSSIHYETANKNHDKLLSKIQVYNHIDSCSVNWVYTFKSKWYPWEKMKSLFNDNVYGAALDSNLMALKKYIEK